MRSGFIVLPSSSAFWLAGEKGYACSSRAVDYTSSILATAYSFAIEANLTIASNGPGARYYGFPLRCLSTALDI